MLNQCCKITFVAAMFFLNTAVAQDSLRTEKFNEIASRVKKMLRSKGNSLEHLTVVHRQLAEYADVNPEEFKKIEKVTEFLQTVRKNDRKLAQGAPGTSFQKVQERKLLEK